jgi:hypothetical protein
MSWLAVKIAKDCGTNKIQVGRSTCSAAGGEQRQPRPQKWKVQAAFPPSIIRTATYCWDPVQDVFQGTPCGADTGSPSRLFNTQVPTDPRSQ